MHDTLLFNFCVSQWNAFLAKSIVILSPKKNKVKIQDDLASGWGFPFGDLVKSPVLFFHCHSLIPRK